MMVDDFEYFAEFLENPAAPDLNEFFRMLHRWIKYIEAHKAEFNYLEDDEWKDIRERLLEEMEGRMDEKYDLEDEWDEINDAIGELPEGDTRKGLELFTRRLEFMKTHQHIFNIPDANITEFEEIVTDFANAMNRAKILETRIQFNELHRAELIADLDESLVEYYEKTGKIPFLPKYKGKKTYKGN